MRDPAPLPPPEVVARLRAAGCVFAEDEAALLIAAAAPPEDLAVMVERRAAGEPLEYVLGWAEFCGLRVAVEPGVFVPRHRTEFLASQAVAHTRPGAIVVDLCCGSGAVGAAVLAASPSVQLHATEIDAAAVGCARRNLATVGGRVHAGDLYHPLPAGLRGRVDVLVANVPYVPTDEIPLLPREARLYEPRQALDGGPDGLDVLRRVAAEAPVWLAPGGHLLVETSAAQAPRAAEILTASGLLAEVTSLDEMDATVVIGAMPGGNRPSREPGVAQPRPGARADLRRQPAR
jgi:release factor glutamine methyltransferase